MKPKQHTNTPQTNEQALVALRQQGLAFVQVSPSLQQLSLRRGNDTLKTYTISTGRNGLGEEKDSYKTPRGLHQIRAKIGAGLPSNAVFKNRRYHGDIFTPDAEAITPGRDWILTRIMWLSGLEPGFNRLGNVDTMQRYIYIHGSPDTRPVGQPTSRGCIRMRNEDIIEFFDLVDCGTRVYIEHS